ncbi:Tol-Pal system beta propeller repeat protein TolB [Kangiella spongicola]|uniref:Tol-Pal system protein TolB n=1 Tax=Kangiella spongicola TaxID=796379 RepID=A0A318D1Y0_9GAMM|nr:Tol-Pal system beta propeller repeat protein TolB [Kangiella spongicola]PXF63160.1 Tol-Pal system protein TolB [Kangiella spongicola]
MKHICKKLMILCIGLMAYSAQAEVQIYITEGRDDARPVAVLPFKFESASEVKISPPHNFSQIIADDLERSGKFKPVDISDLPQNPSDITEVDIDAWKELGVDGVVYGVVKETAPGKYMVSYDLIDPYNDKAVMESNIASGSYPLVDQSFHLMVLKTKLVNDDNFRWAAHIAADEIYEALTGERGAFATQIAYVQVDRLAEKPYELNVADSDGFNQTKIFSSKQPIMSPTWSPDANKLAYVSFENGRSEIFIQTIATGQRELIASFKGFNSAPAWSPDGTKMAMVLSKDGNPEIYVMDLATKSLKRLTRHYAIDTEPSWNPDGKSLIFTSDRGGKPQIYRVSLAGGDAERVTFEGRYNAGAEFAPDGKTIVMVHQSNGNFHVAAQDIETGNLTVLTTTSLDESLSVAPNSSMIIFSTVDGRQKVLSAVSMDGRFKARLPANVGEVKAPAWSPFIL